MVIVSEVSRAMAILRDGCEQQWALLRLRRFVQSDRASDTRDKAFVDLRKVGDVKFRCQNGVRGRDSISINRTMSV